MDELQLLLEKRIQELTSIIEKAEKCILESPEGSLRVDQNHYYHRTEATDTHGKYIRKTQVQFLEQLAQKDYAKKIYSKAMIEREQLIRCLHRYHPEALLDTYKNIAIQKKKLIKPYILPEMEYIKQWKDGKLVKKIKYGKDDLVLIPEEDAIITEQGERVRSKSEKILADKLYMMNIPYVYECPIHFRGYGYIKPDFTVLNYRTRQEFIWEHFGLMDNKEYCEKAIKKIETYQKNRNFPGRGLIISYETSTHPLNGKIIEGLVEEYLV